MKKYHDSIIKHLNRELENSAMNYLEVGLEMFHKSRKFTRVSSHPSIGNLGIAIELMLKAFIAKNNPLILFKGLPMPLQVLFACPDSLPKDFNWRPFDIELRSFKYETKDLNECISIFYIFLPKHKQELYPHFQLLSRCRNVSIHAALPSFQKYEHERLAYLVLRVFSILQAEKTLSKYAYSLTKDDKRFLSSFKSERIERVRKKIEKAKEKSKHITTETTSISVDGWDMFIAECPICGLDGILTGYTDIMVEGNPEYPDESLDFFADTFECEECGLKLDDSDELELAGMDLYYDRSNELESWYGEHYEPDFSDFD